MDSRYDAVIVGSGFGGGITACRLAEAGSRVCVLERGRRFAREDFIDRPEDAPQLLWHPDLNPGGIFDLRLMSDLSVLTAAAVGGGSLIYASVHLRAPAPVFESGWPAAIDRQTLEPYYERAERSLGVRPTPDSPRLRKIRAFEATARRAGHEPERLPLAVHFGEDREHPLSGVPQGGCENLALCDVGCPRHAKNTVDITYLARAENLGAEVFPLHEATRIEPPASPGEPWRVGFRVLDGGSQGAVEAPLCVLAAGCLGTTRLLLQNRDRLPDLSPALGSRFSGNGDALGAAFDPRAPDAAGADTHIGPVMTSRIADYQPGDMMLADGALPKEFSGLLEIVRGLNAHTGWQARLFLRLKALAARFGLSDQLLTPRSMRLAERPPITDALVFLMIGEDAADGQMRLTPLFRRFDIRWRGDASRELFERMERATEEMAAAADGTAYFALNGGPLGKFITVHPLGGCPMADDPAAGVVDDHGRVRGYPGLVVSDGSIVPTALGVNPSNTIAALSERNVEAILAESA